MKEIILLRRERQRQALRPTGIAPNVSRVFASQGRSISTDVDILSLPVFSVANLQDLATGALYYMLDLDGLDGGNALA